MTIAALAVENKIVYFSFWIATFVLEQEAESAQSSKRR